MEINSLRTEEEYIDKFYLGDIFPELEDRSSFNEVALFALSTYTKPRGEEKYVNTNVISVDQETYKYYYQQEVGFIKDRATLGKNGLDYAIVLFTNSTAIEKKTPIIVRAESDNEDEEFYEISSSEKDFVKKILERGNILKNTEVKENILNKWSEMADSFSDIEKSDNPRIIYVSVEDKSESGIAQAVSKVISVIRGISEHNQTRIHYYNNGGFREIPSYLDMIMSLIRDASNVHIEKNIIEYYDGKAAIKPAQRGVENFVSGINELRNYGKIDSLKKYYGLEDAQGAYGLAENDKDFLECLNRISMGIQTNQIANFQKGLDELSEIKRNGKEALSDEYLRLFFDEIVNDYKFIEYKNTDIKKYIIEMMRWTYSKGYYQQLITMIESFVPYLLEDCHMFSYSLDQDYIDNIVKRSGNEPVHTVFNVCVVRFIRIVGNNDFIGGKIINDTSYRKKIKITATDSVFRLIQSHKKIKSIRNQINHVSYKNYTVMNNKLEVQLEIYLNQLKNVLNKSGEKIEVISVHDA